MWKTVAMRIRGATTELEQAGLETEGMAKSTASLRDTIMQITNIDGKGGFDIMLDDKTFKSTYDIILGIGKVWKDIADVDQAALLELLAGKRQGNALAAALTNLEDLQKALETSADSAGSAQRVYEVWLTSLEAKINQFKAVFEALSDTVFNSELLKNAVDFGTELLKILDSLIQSFGGLGNMLVNIAAIVAMFNVSQTISLLTKLLNKINLFSKAEKTIRNVAAAIDLAKNGAAEGGTTLGRFASALTGVSQTAALATIGIAAVVAAITIAIAVYKKHQQELEETRRKTLETANAAITEADAFQEAYIKYKQYANRTDLTESEEEEFKAAIDEVNKALEDKAYWLGVNTDRTNDYADALDRAAQKEFEKALTTAKQAQQAAKELLNSDSYSSWNGSLITLDLSGRTGIEKFQNALETVRKYMGDYLDEGTYGLELEPINWDSNAGTLDAIDSVVQYYHKLIETRDALTNLDQMDNDIYNGIVKIIGSIEDDVKAYEKATFDVLKNQYYIDNGIPKTVEEFKTFRQNIIDSMGEDFQVDVSDDSSFVNWIDKQLLDDDTYKKFASEIANESAVADQIRQNRKDLVNELTKFDEFQKADWHGALGLLQQYRAYVDDLSSDELTAALEQIKNGAVKSFGDLKTAMEAFKIPTLFSGNELGNLREFYDDIQRLNKQAQMLGVELDKTVYGNIDTNNRQILEWTDENIERFRKEIESWDMIPEELAGNISTVLGSFDEFDGVEIAYTPILNTNDGAELLSKDTVFRYFEALAEKAGEGWTNEDFLRLDAEGLEIDGRKISNLIAGIGEEAERASYAMHFTGNVGAIALDMQELENAAENAGISVEALMFYLEQMTTRYANSAEGIRNTLSELWGSDDFKTARQEIEKLAKTAGGVTVDAVNKLADSSEELRNILNQDGMSAEFLAKVLTQLGKGNYDALNLVTEDALRLGDALMGLEDQFGNVTAAKSKFDAAMSAGEKNDNFKSYAEAFKKLNDEFVAGTTNSNAFWAAAEYLFGSDQLNEWGWADGIDQIYEAMQKNVAIFQDAESSGAGFLEQLYKIAEGGKVLDSEGNVLAEIQKFSDGSYDFNIDASNLDALADRMGITKEAVIACVQAISMFGEVNLFDVNEVIDALTGAALAFDTLNGTAVNLDGFIDQLTTLGKTDKEIYDILKVLREVDGISFVSASGNVEELTNSLINLGLAVQDEDAFKINTTGLSVLMEQLSFTKDEAENVIKKLSETDDITLTNANGEVVTLSEALSKLNDLNFTEVQNSVDGIADALGDVNETDTDDAEDSLYEIRDAADLAKKEIEQLQTKINSLTGKEVTITVDVKRKSNVLSLLGFAKGTDDAPETDAVVGEKGEELIVGKDGAYIAGQNGAEIVHLHKGDAVYTAEETAKIRRNGKVFSGRIPAYYDGRASGTISTGSGNYTSLLPTSGSGKSGSSSSSTTAKAESEFERLYKYHQHLLAMEQESTEEYLNWLVVAYKEAFDKGEIELDDFRKYEEEVFKGLKTVLDEVIGDLEHGLFLGEKNNNMSVDQVVATYRKMQEEVHDLAEHYRELGIDENSDLIQTLQKQWWDYHDEIVKAITDAYEKVRQENENAITLNENWLNNAISKGDYDSIREYTNNVINHYRAMQEEIHKQAEYYRSLGYSDTSDEVSKLSDLWWDYYDAIKKASADAWAAVVSNANEALDSIQGVYDTLKNAAKEYAENGYLTIDTLQKICSWGLEYLDFLKDENGQLVINEESIQRVIAARTEQMAVETAMQYVEQLRTASMEGNIDALNRLLFATQQTASATWDLVYAQLETVSLNKEQYNAALQKIDNLRALTKVTIQGIGKIDGELKKSLENSKSALEDILKYVEAMIKQEVENQVTALENQVRIYKEIVDQQKKALELERKRDEYAQSVEEKVKKQAKLQAQIALLDLDDSRSAQAQKVKLQEELAEVSNELADKQSDYAYDRTVDALDDMYDAYEKSKNKEIETLKNTISSEEKLYQLSIERINTQWDSLYEQLIAWNTEYGSDTNQKLTEAWNSACSAVQTYGSYLEAVEAITQRIAAMDISSSSSYPTVVSETPNRNTSDTGTALNNYLTEMKQNSTDWHTAHNNGDTAEEKRLEARNEELARLISNLIGEELEKRNGTWYIKGTNTQLYAKYHTYHTGTASAGQKATLKQDEVFAKLQKGETVLNERQQEGLFRYVDTADTVMAKYGKVFGAAANSDLSAQRMQEQIRKDANSSQNAVDSYQNSTIINVPVQIHTVQKLDEQEIKQLSRRIGDDTISTINNQFSKNGKRHGLPILKP